MTLTLLIPNHYPVRIDHSHIVSIRPSWAHSQRRVGVNITIPLHWPSCEWTLTLPNFPSLCSVSAIISFQTCSNKCILYVLSFHKCIKIKYKTVNMYGVFLWLVQSSSRWNIYYTLSSQLPCSTVECSGRRILSSGQIAIINTIWE